MLKTPPSLNNLVVIAPHPDDEAIGCASFFRNRQVKKLIVVTDGGIQTIRKTMGNEKYVLKRQKESLTFASRFGVNLKNIYFLGYHDGQLNRIEIKELFQKIAPLIKPEEILLIPSNLDGHQDHQYVSKLGGYFRNKVVYYTITGSYNEDQSVLKVKSDNKLLVKKYYLSQYWRLLKSNFPFRTYEEYKFA